MTRQKRAKIYHVPITKNRSDRIQHASFTANERKITVRSSFVKLPDCSDPTPLASPTVHDDHGPPLSQDDMPFVHYFNHTVNIDALSGLSTGCIERQPTLDDLLSSWMSERDKYLAEMIMLDGRGCKERCAQCGATGADFRCLECMGDDIFCSSCLVSNHGRSPFHVIQKWNGNFFERANLKNLGLRIQLGHAPGVRCLNPHPAIKNEFVVLHTNGIHSVAIDFCACETAPELVAQLLRSRLFPATTKLPRLAATFDVLRHFQTLSFESKVSVFEFYHTISRLSNNIISSPLDHYKSFLRMVREWRHLKMLKRAGRGHDPAGVTATAQGECAIRCPACPQPGINLPNGWKNTPENRRWLYTLFVGIDANFKLKCKKVSSKKIDPSLSKGWSYFIEEKPYKVFLEEHKNQPQERSTCSNYDAIAKANSKDTRYLDTTGAGTVDCVRHDMKRPNAVGDLQKGEWYINMDYIFFNTIREHVSELTNVVVSYDIGCQWGRNLWTRMKIFPQEYHIDYNSVNVVFLVPKFHLPAHRPACQLSYSFNLTPHVGQTDGEAPERGWSNTNALGSSTKEMGPGSRRDTLDDHFGDMNWKKVCGLGVSLLRKVQAAVPERNKQLQLFQELTDSVSSSVVQWRESVEAWERDRTSQNPFEFQGRIVSLASVRLKLLQQEAEEIQQSTVSTFDHAVSHSVLISMGLELEEQQRRLQFDISMLSQHATDNQLGKIQERKNTLQRKIDTWVTIQDLYVPGLAILRRAAYGLHDDHPHTTTLWLPSVIAGKITCDRRLYMVEWELRLAQANNSLHDLRQHLQLRSHLYKYKDRFATGQQANTWANASISRAQQQINICVTRYRVSRQALLSLAPQLSMDDSWKVLLPELQEGDVRGMTIGDEGETEGRRTISWIWRCRGELALNGDDIGNLHESLRVEWCKARARALRWTEEVILLLEEMRRVLQYLEWKANVWDARATSFGLDPNAAQRSTVKLVGSGLLLYNREEGLRAYALYQAWIQRELHGKFKSLWADVPSLVLSFTRTDNDTALDSHRHFTQELSSALFLFLQR